MSQNLQFSLPFEPSVRRKQSPLRRRVFRLQLDPSADGTYFFKARSFSRLKGKSYRLRVNPRTGEVWCSCRDFMYRKGPEHPSFWHGPLCKHLQRAIRTVKKVERHRDEA